MGPHPHCVPPSLRPIHLPGWPGCTFVRGRCPHSLWVDLTAPPAWGRPKIEGRQKRKRFRFSVGRSPISAVPLSELGVQMGWVPGQIRNMLRICWAQLYSSPGGKCNTGVAFAEDLRDAAVPKAPRSRHLRPGRPGCTAPWSLRRRLPIFPGSPHFAIKNAKSLDFSHFFAYNKDTEEHRRR